MAPLEHMEVAPRMWDKTIAATYDPTVKSAPEKTQSEVDEDEAALAIGPPSAAVGAVSNNVSFFSRFKTVIIPALFVLGLIIVSYVLWKYFTKYRNAKRANINKNIPVIEADDIPSLKRNPTELISSQDMSKYEYDSDTSDDDNNRPPPLLSSIKEEEEEDVMSVADFNAMPEKSSSGESSDDEDEDEEEEDEEDDASSESSESSVSSVEEVEAPDVSAIEELIANDTSLPMLEDEFSFDIPVYVEKEPSPLKEVKEPPVAKRSKPSPRKAKRVTL